MKKSAKHVQAAICMAMCFCLVSCAREEVPAGSPEPEVSTAVSTQLETSAFVDPIGTQTVDTSDAFTGEQTQVTEAASTTNATEKHAASTTSATTKAVSRPTQAPTKAPTQPETAPTTYPTDAQGRPILPPPEFTTEEAYTLYLASLASTYSMEEMDLKSSISVSVGDRQYWNINQQQVDYQGQSMLSYKAYQSMDDRTLAIAFDGINAYYYEGVHTQALINVGYPSTLEQFQKDFMTTESDEMSFIWFCQEDITEHKSAWVTAFRDYKIYLEFRLDGNQYKERLERELIDITGDQSLVLTQVDSMVASIGFDPMTGCFYGRTLDYIAKGTVNGEQKTFDVRNNEDFKEPTEPIKKPDWCTDKITSREDLFGPGF